MPREWQFVPTQTDGKAREDSSRTLVRRTAMRSFRRNERLDRMTKLDAGPSLPKSAAPSQEESDLHLQWRATLVDIGPVVAFDPFVSTTLHSNRDYIELFTRFVYVIAGEIQPLGRDVTKNPFGVVFARNALADPMVLSALLYHASVHRRSCSAATLFHLGETVRQLALRLEQPAEAASDNSIAAAGLLAATGNITGDFNEERAHWEACQKMIRMRGGLQALGWDGALAMILSVDMISATITFSKPRLDCPQVPNGLDISLSIQPIAAPLLQEPDNVSLHLEIHTLIRSISELASRFAESNSILTSSTAAVISYTQVLSAIEHRLISLHIPYSSDPPSNIAVLYAFEMSRIAALISTTYYFRGISMTSVTICSLQKRLVRTALALETLRDKFLDNSCLKLLLWACWLAGLTAKDQEWFAIRIHGYMNWLELHNWEELETCLEGFVLAPRRHDLHGNSLWDRVSKNLT